MTASADQIIEAAEANAGFYDGSLEYLLPWSFWVQDLADPHADVDRLLSVWNGHYLQVRHFGAGAEESYWYLFRDGLGFAGLFISPNMALRYLRYFINQDHVHSELRRLGVPTRITPGLPSADDIENAEISGDDLPEFLAFARAVAIEYVAGGDYSEAVRDLVIKFRDAVTESRHD